MHTPFTEKIPSLFQGISKQAPSIRFPGQVESASNISFNVVDGARKRPGSKFLCGFTDDPSGVLQSISPWDDYKIHRIERDDEEEYAVIYGHGVFQILDVNTGALAAITYATTNARTYLQISGGEPEELKFTTIADTTFIANINNECNVSDGGEDLFDKTMPVKLTRTKVSPLTFEVSKIDWTGRSFHHQKITQDTNNSGGTFRLRCFGDKTKVDLPYNCSAQNVEDALQGNGYDPDQFDSDPDAGTVDALGILGLPAFPYGKVICTGGPLDKRPIKVQISPDLEMDRLMDTTENNTNNSITISRGDDANDPAPQFALQNLKVTDISSFRNRLVIAAGPYIAFSSADNLYNFFLESPPNVTDSDWFEIQIAGEDVSEVENLTTFRSAILATSKSSKQFEVKGGDTFTAKSVALTPTTSYDTQKVRPVKIGDRMYMVGQGTTHSTLLEYYYDDTSLSSRAADLSKHVDNFLPTPIQTLVASPNREIVICAPDTTGSPARTFTATQTGDWNDTSTWDKAEIPQGYDDAVIPSGITVSFTGTYIPPGGSAVDNFAVEAEQSFVGKAYVYRSYTVGNERKQSAWSEWDFGEDVLMDMAIYDDVLLIMRRIALSNGNMALIFETLDLGESEDKQAGFANVAHLDHQIMEKGTASNVSYDSNTNLTKWTMKDVVGIDGYTDNSIDTVVLTTGVELSATATSSVSNRGTEVFVAGDYRTADVLFGRKVKSEIVLSQVFMRDKEQRPIRDGRTRLKKLVLEHRDAGQYQVKVANDDALCPDRTTDVGTVATIDGFGHSTTWCHGEAEELTITLTSNNAQPCTWTSVEYHGEHDGQTE